MAKNKMNIDMGDFFGGGDAQPAKKEVKPAASRFGFGGFATSVKKPLTGSIRRTSTKGNNADEDYENPMDLGVQQSLRTPPKSGISGPAVPPISLTSQSATSAAMAGSPKIGAKPAPRVVSTGERKLQPQTAASVKPAAESTAKIISPSNVPAASPIVLESKSSVAKLSVAIENSKPAEPSASSGLASPTSAKVPPPLPPRPLSPKGSSNMLKTVSDVSPPKPLSDQTGTANVDKLATARSSNVEKDQKVDSQVVDSSSTAKLSVVSSPITPAPQQMPSPSPLPQSTPPPRKLSLIASTSKPSGSGLLSLDPTKAERTDELRPEIAPWTVFSEDPDKTLKNEELRSAVAPWTVFSEDPDKTLANEDLRSQVAPWTSEPEPEPVRERSTEKSPVNNKVIGMGAFFSNSDSNMDDDEMEFENPLLSGNPKVSADEDEMVSKPAVTKKTWIGARPSQVEIKKSSPSSPLISAVQQAAAKKPEPPKAIDYGEVFKSPGATNDDEDSFMNDPEFRDAPEFEW